VGIRRPAEAPAAQGHSRACALGSAWWVGGLGDMTPVCLLSVEGPPGTGKSHATRVPDPTKRYSIVKRDRQRPRPPSARTRGREDDVY
jgi:hypothetical protein